MSHDEVGDWKLERATSGKFGAIPVTMVLVFLIFVQNENFSTADIVMTPEDWG